LPCCSSAVISISLRWPRTDERGIHRLAVYEREPALRDAVDRPHGHGEPDHHADLHDHERPRDEHPGEPDPERAQLPVEVRLEPGVPDVVDLQIVDDDGDDPAEPDQEPDRLQDIDEQSEVAQPLLSGLRHHCLGHLRALRAHSRDGPDLRPLARLSRLHEIHQIYQ
jgi:hypothetical protein